MKFSYYVLNYDVNLKRIVQFNVFDNSYIQERVEEEIKKYIRSPKKYKKEVFSANSTEDRVLFGFDALCEEIRGIFMYQMLARREYEISVGDAFETDLSRYEKIDCYCQILPNIQTVVRDCIYQYRKQIRDKRYAYV